MCRKILVRSRITRIMWYYYCLFLIPDMYAIAIASNTAAITIMATDSVGITVSFAAIIVAGGVKGVLLVGRKIHGF